VIYNGKEVFTTQELLQERECQGCISDGDMASELCLSLECTETSNTVWKELGFPEKEGE
jgi:hypothetical protein